MIEMGKKDWTHKFGGPGAAALDEKKSADQSSWRCLNERYVYKERKIVQRNTQLNPFACIDDRDEKKY